MTPETLLFKWVWSPLCKLTSAFVSMEPRFRSAVQDRNLKELIKWLADSRLEYEYPNDI